MRRITIAIDGPAASGKSTTARAVAQRLGYRHLNSGLIYRAITWAAIRGGWIDDDRFDQELDRVELSLVREPPFGVRVGVEDPADGLTSHATAARVSEVSARPSVRAKAVQLLRAAGREGGVVCEGRDIGTVVFPDAELKIFLVASTEERGRRRLLDHGLAPTAAKVEEEAERLASRDEADSSRPLAPLRRAPDAIEIDTTDVSPERIVEDVVRLARVVAGHTTGGAGGDAGAHLDGRPPPEEGPVG